MAGKNETPRQKMIGMMYLVLTALLALNVSKEVIAAFVTINDKINASSRIIEIKSQDNYLAFDQKEAELVASKSSLENFNYWHNKAIKSRTLTDNLVDFLMSESNEMIKSAEGQDWVESRDKNGHIESLKPLIDIRNMDNYDIPTNIFIGSNPAAPRERGKNLQKKIHAFRDSLCILMGNINYGDKTYSFTPPSNPDNIDQALSNVLPEDRAQIKQVYQALTTPEKLKSYSKDKGYMPWISVMFDHAPIVAAASMLNALKLDIKNSEAEVSDFFLSKVEAPPFVFNKIEALPFASSRYINSGDSLAVNVMIAAYDSTAGHRLKYGIDGDTLENKWQSAAGSIKVKGTVGQHKIKGAIAVEEQGNTRWKPWSFEYTVGEPVATISQPEMRVLYRAYNNIIEASASGFSAEKLSLVGSGCSITRVNGQKYRVLPNSGARSANITIYAEQKDGSRLNLGTHTYRVKSMPVTETYLGNIKNGDTPLLSNVTSQTATSVRFGSDVMIKQVPFNIIKGQVFVEGINKTGKVKRGGRLDNDAISVLKQSRGKTVTIILKYRDPSNRTRSAMPLMFKPR